MRGARRVEGVLRLPTLLNRQQTAKESAELTSGTVPGEPQHQLGNLPLAGFKSADSDRRARVSSGHAPEAPLAEEACAVVNQATEHILRRHRHTQHAILP